MLVEGGRTAELGDDVMLFHGVTLGGTSGKRVKRHPTLGNKVMVGAGAKILGDIHVGSNAKVGANSVVVKDVPAGEVWAGNPARPLRKYPRRTAEQLTPSEEEGWEQLARGDGVAEEWVEWAKAR